MLERVTGNGQVSKYINKVILDIDKWYEECEERLGAGVTGLVGNFKQGSQRRFPPENHSLIKYAYWEGASPVKVWGKGCLAEETLRERSRNGLSEAVEPEIRDGLLENQMGYIKGELLFECLLYYSRLGCALCLSYLIFPAIWWDS